MPAKDASARGRAAVSRGKWTERAVATALCPYWPTARRSRDNGSVTTPDMGDIAGAADAVIFWSVKGDRQASQPAVMARWLAEMRGKAGGRLAILVERRERVGNPYRWWARVWLDELLARTPGATPGYPATPATRIPVCFDLGHLLELLAAYELTDTAPDHPPETPDE